MSEQLPDPAEEFRGELGRVAYEAWREQGEIAAPTWEQMSDQAKERWKIIGQSVCNFYQRDLLARGIKYT